MAAPTVDKVMQEDPTPRALEFAHRLLSIAPDQQPSLEKLLGELAVAFAANGAGLAELTGGMPVVRGRVPSLPNKQSTQLPWDHDTAFLGQLTPAAPARTIARPEGGSFLISAGAGGAKGYVVWIESTSRSRWDLSEAAALAVVGQAFTTWIAALDGTHAPRWADRVDREGRQQSMEIAASVTRRLAHDFGNVLTGILGFSELSITQQVPSGTALHTYLHEVHRAAENGAQFTQQLRLFSRRQATVSGATNLAALLGEEERRLRAVCGHAVTLNMRVAPDLPSVGVDNEQIRLVLAALLENAREATAGSNQGTVTISADVVELTAEDCLDLYGDPRPGRHVELRVTDNGTGLSREAERRLFAEPFFSTKPRRRGFGLSLAYGVATAHHGGVRLLRAGERGVIVRVVLPLGSAPIPAAAAPVGSSGGDRVLVVDDDPLILQFVCTTLERAGYRVHAAENAEDALTAYSATDRERDPFRLVLSDVIMPKVTGVDLARRLLARDPNARVLFMSGQVPGDFVDDAQTLHQFDLLQKPFRPDGLLKAVSSALDRAAGKRGLIHNGDAAFSTRT